MNSVGVIGGTGYTGKELIRLISRHPKLELEFATSRSEEGEKISDVHSNIRGFIDHRFVSPKTVGNHDVDLVFCAVPHTKGMKFVPELRKRGIKVIDLSADYRIDADVFEEFYDKKHIDEGREAVYGLTELNKEKIRDSEFVANPGCFPTGALLSILPLLEKNVDIRYLLFDSKTGISGAGARASEKTHFPNVDGEVSPYNLVAHRHVAELEKIIEENVNDFGFTPHIVPIVRGILTTTHLLGVNKKNYKELYEDYFEEMEFIRVIGDVPKLKSVKGSNYVDIGGFEVEENRIVILSAIDNLVKGASGQAIQNANLMLGFKETLGLKEPGLSP